MIIRARDQASHTIRSIGTNATAEMEKLSRRTRLQMQNNAIAMAHVRNAFGQSILQMQRDEVVARRRGDTATAEANHRAIQDLKHIRDERLLNMQQQQLMDRQTLHSQNLERLKQREAIEAQQQMMRTGGQMVAVGATLAVVGGLGVKAMHSMAMSAVEYQRQAALTATQVHTQSVAVEDLLAISNRVAGSVGAPLERMQVALYDIFSSTDVSVKDSEGVLRSFAKAAVAGQVDIQQAGRATIAIMNAWGVSAGGVNRILDIQFEAVRLGSMTYAEFSSAVGKAIPAVRNSSQSIEFLAGSAAFLTRNGQTAAMAMTAIARGSEMFLRKPVQQELRAMGIEALNASGRLRPINDILTEMAPHFANLDDMARKRLFEKIFGGQNFAQARRFFDLAIIKSAELNRFIRDVTASTGSFSEAYNRMAATTAVQTELLKNNWKIFRNTLGAEVMPQLNALIQWSTEFLMKMNQMDSGRKKMIADMMLWGSVATTAVGALIALSGAIVILNAGIKTAALWFGTVNGAITTFTARSALAQSATVALGGSTATLASTLGGLGIVLGIAAVATSALTAAQRVGTGIHHDYIRPFYEWLGIVEKGTGARNDALASMSDERKAMYEGERAALAAGNSVEELAAKNNGLIPTIKQVAQMTEEERKQIEQLAQQIVQSGINNYWSQQEKLKDATKSLADAQADLARIQGGSVPTVKSLSSAQEGVHDATVRVERAQLSLSDKTADSRLEHIRLREAQHDLVRAQDAYRGSNKSTAASSDELKNAVERVKNAQDALREATGLTAKETSAKFREIADATKNMSDNMVIMIRRGFDPGLVAELAKEGPLQVAKFKNLSTKEIRELNKNFRDSKTQEMRAQRIAADAMAGDIAKYQQAGTTQVEKLRKHHADKMETMLRNTRAAMMKAGESVAGFRVKANGELGLIHDEPVNVQAKASIQWSKDAATAKFRAGRMATGGVIRQGTTGTADDVPIWASKGEYIVNARQTAQHREVLEAINAGKYATGGIVMRMKTAGLDSMIRGATERMNATANQLDRMGFKMLAKYIAAKDALGGFGLGKANILRFIRSVDPLPYIWGGAGPGGYDCSGLTGAVALAQAGRPYGHGQRVWQTDSIRPGAVPGLKAGTGGVYQIGVTPGRGHMAGRYGGLKFEARGRQAGILIGPAARSPESFARRYYMAQGGYISPDDYRAIGELIKMGFDIGGDFGKTWARFGGKERVFDTGGWLDPGTTIVHNNTGRRERVSGPDEPFSPTNTPGMDQLNRHRDGTGDVNITINTQEMVPEREAQMLGWYLQRRL